MAPTDTYDEFWEMIMCGELFEPDAPHANATIKQELDKDCDPRPLRSATLPDFPAYKCHKVVRAAKITTIEPVGQHDYRIFFQAKFGCKPVQVTATWMRLHRPKAGGYFVVYEDEYTSYSPADAFENGYSRLGVASNTGIGVDVPSLYQEPIEGKPSPCKGQPPAELRPRAEIIKARRREIECAFGRRCKKNYPIPADWVREYVTIVKELFDEKRRTDV